MLNEQPEAGAKPPLFSVIVPLESHRGQWEQSWRGWMAQTVDRSLYEIILVVPPAFPARQALDDLTHGQARIEFSNSSHDIGLCAFGATKARGQYLFFTESHCRPEPEVMELCIQAVAEHPDWTGFSCRSVPILHNRLSQAEAEMYETDIESGMKVHPWRKVLDQCFVTRRDVYEECGGLREELGHFAEWVLAAAYHARGHAIGYLEAARFHHYYTGRIGELKTFTLDFVEGEIRFLSEYRSEPGSELLEISVEWSCQDNFDSRLARAALSALLRDGRSHPGRQRWPERWRSVRRWLEPALFGDRAARGIAWLAAARARCKLTLAAIAGSHPRVSLALKRYISALIHSQRLASVHRLRRAGLSVLPRLGVPVLAQVGFHAEEAWQGRPFRWSEPEAALCISADAGAHVVRIECPGIRLPLDKIDVRFYRDGARIPLRSVATQGDAFHLRIEPPSPGTYILAWICAQFEAPGDERSLGLPVTKIEVIPVSPEERRDMPLGPLLPSSV